MSVFEDLKSFCKGCLKPVETEVTTADGRKLKESKDNEGKVIVRVTGNGLGFVADFKPDLQMAEIMPWLILGSQDAAHEIALLKKHSITHILNVATGIPNFFDKTFTYKKIYILDLPDVDIQKHFDECAIFIRKARDSGGRVFVHCNAGVSRSATIVIAYLMKIEQMRYTEAYTIVKGARPIIRPNEGFTKQLLQYDMDLYGIDQQTTPRKETHL